jgi:hypothetical protein
MTLSAIQYQNGADKMQRARRISVHWCALLQSLRDMRQGGAILCGNQEFLEQCGVNPTTAFNELKPFIEAEHKHRFGGTKELMEFVYTLAESLIERGATPSLMSRRTADIIPLNAA